ncbi:MAG TPA: chloride channel protein, partial [Streptosporangiaceae bacterium]
ALLGAAMQAPLASLALVLELTHSGFQIMVPMLAATVTATIVSRYIDGYSIYSARLPPQRGGPSRRARPPGRPEPQTDTEGLDTA